MADFTTPFGENSERRTANADEKDNGLPCGPADRELFNGLFHQVQAEMNEIHSAGGIAGTDDAFNTTLLNIRALIASAIGTLETDEEDNPVMPVTDGFLLTAQARTRLPIHIETLTADGKINVTSPSTGVIRIPPSVNFLHRGVYPVTTSQVDFNLSASKTYHLRWSVAGDYELKDLSDNTYNPTNAPETNVAFDSTFDDMLISRIVTNSNNVPSITNLVNKCEITENADLNGFDARLSGRNGANFLFTHTLEWARTPSTHSLTIARVDYGDNNGGDVDFRIMSGNITSAQRSSAGPALPTDTSLDRYTVNKCVVYDNATVLSLLLNARA